jgi:Tol biopolymer transport system component
MADMSNNLRSRMGHIVTVAAFTLLAAGALTATPALAAAGEGCPNEQVRQESNTNPTTGQPYSQGLPECRAYEMVSPLEKQQHDALVTVAPLPVSVSPDGSAIQWSSQGAYAGAENYQAHASKPTNPYVAQRTASGWITRSGYPPSSLIAEPSFAFSSAGTYSPDLAGEAVCGTVTITSNVAGPTMRCALRQPDGSWASTPEYTDLTGQNYYEDHTVGASSTGEDVVFLGEIGNPFLSSDTSSQALPCNGIGNHCGGIYEMAGVGTGSPELRLVNVDNSGNMIGPENKNAVGGLETDHYQAVSTDGSKIYFTATPTGGVPTIYARIDGNETVTISNPSPSECTRTGSEPGGECNTEPQPAYYQGASANGSKVFFTTTQQLVNGDTDSTTDLYEYDFNSPPGHRVVQVSGGGLGDVTPGAGAGVRGVVSISEDGSHVYFVAESVLTTLPNGLGQTASANSDNLYAYDTGTGETQFVATLLESDQGLWGVSEVIEGTQSHATWNLAQTTPDGRYLVFDSFAKLITAGPEADTSGAQQVYRYDFQTGHLLRVSVGHEGAANNGNTPGVGAVIGLAWGEEAGPPTANGENRTISANGETIAFVTTEQLQSTDVAGGSNKSCKGGAYPEGAGCEVYVWHNGSVNMISDGQDPNGFAYAGMSASGSDIFFQTRTQLVGQDTDTLGDIYDARIGGGFPAPTLEPSCSGESCQGSLPAAPSFGASGSSTVTAGGNLTPGSTSFPPPEEPKAKPLTRAQKLAKALKQCKKDKNKKKRTSCEKEAKKKYGPKAQSKSKK